MPRSQLEIGTCGNIKITEKGGKYRARTLFRDLDGVIRDVERWAPTKSGAEVALKRALVGRVPPGQGEVTAETKFRSVAERWLAGVRRATECGKRSPGTWELYNGQLNNHVLPALGELRMRELTVARIDGFLGQLATRRGISTCKTVRTIVSGVVKEAIRHDAISVNPTREVSAIESGRKKSPRGLTPEQCKRWIRQLEDDEQATRKDLPDLTRFMLATGVRIGEALALLWENVELDDCVVRVEHNIVRVSGVGLVRKGTKTDIGERTLPLPSWGVEMLRRRRASARSGNGPVFPDSEGGWRDPSNTRRDLRRARGTAGFSWVTSHAFRKTAATMLDDAGLSARVVADQLGHSRPSITQDVYLARKAVPRATANALETLEVT